MSAASGYAYRSNRGSQYLYRSRRNMSAPGYSCQSNRGLRSALAQRSRRMFSPPSADSSQRGSLLGLGYFWPAYTTTSGYIFLATGGISVSALPIVPTAQDPTLRTGDVKIPFSIDFSPDISSTDTLSSVVVTVWAQPSSSPTATPTDVTATILQGSPTIAGFVAKALLGNANAVLNTTYTARFIVTLATGEKLQESITRITCDE